MSFHVNTKYPKNCLECQKWKQWSQDQGQLCASCKLKRILRNSPAQSAPSLKPIKTLSPRTSSSLTQCVALERKHVPSTRIDDPIHQYRNVTLTEQASAVVGSNYTYNNCQFFYGSALVNTEISPPFPQQRSHRPPSTGLFETYHLRRPELYTVDSKEATISCLSGTELAKTTTSQSILFTFIYRPTYEEVVHVELAMKINWESSFWLQLEADNPARNAGTDLPRELLLRFAKWLQMNRSHERLLRVGSNCDRSTAFCYDDLPPDTSTDKLQISFHQRLDELTNVLLHGDCEWYDDFQLARKPMDTPLRSCRSFVFHPRLRKWAIETRFTPGTLTFNAQLHTLKVIRQLSIRNCVRASEFLGLVRDLRGRITGFMTDLPERGYVAHIIDEANRLGKPVARERRRKWCRQLLSMVAEVHRQGHVIGVLGRRFMCTLAIDRYDRISITSLFHPRSFAQLRTYAGGVAPEQRGLNEDMNNTPQTDLFQLGLVLWRIAGSYAKEGSADFCGSVGCDCPKGVSCDQPHANPVALAMDGTDIDADVKSVIEICRSADPADRWPAKKLLNELMGRVSEEELTFLVDATEQTDTDKQNDQVYRPVVGCDLCGHYSLNYFHCRICSNDDFDVCERCFQEGGQCEDTEHFLREYVDQLPRNKYFSSCNSDGGREVRHSDPGPL